MEKLAKFVVTLVVGIIIGLMLKPSGIKIVHVPVEKIVEKEVVKEVHVDREVVKRIVKHHVKIVKEQCQEPIKIIVRKKIVVNRERLFLTAGSGPKGISTKTEGSTVTVKPDRGLLLGVGYHHKITPELSIGAEFLNNNSYLGQIGFDF